jgi:L-alanine-DL-glutamate epimerase-like enolase superfamily enzyme
VEQDNDPDTGKVTRRQALGAGAGLLLGSRVGIAIPFDMDMKVLEVRTSYEDYHYRAPYKFGGVVVDKVTLLNVRVRASGRYGQMAEGFGSMPLGNAWSFPSQKLTYDQTLAAMRSLAEKIAAITGTLKEWGHPIDLNVILEPDYFKAAEELSRDMAEPIPPLCTIVTASPFDAAMHDAYGKLHRQNCFQTLGPLFMRNDLAHYLGPEFKGEKLDLYIPPQAMQQLPLYHSVGASDPITDADVKQKIGDGLPETLPEWIRYNGITHIKIKLIGNDRDGDMDRVIRVHQAAISTGRADFAYSLDFNEKCPNVGYLLDFLRNLKQRSADAFGRIQYVEQPTARDLKAHPDDDVHEAAKIVPVVIDESLTGIDAFLLALKMGYSGAALKACKGQSMSLLIAAMAIKRGVFLCAQDLTCPGASLVHSVTLAAHVPGVQGIEANAREYVPAANAGWDRRFPGIFNIRDGQVRTFGTQGPGLGVIPL